MLKRFWKGFSGSFTQVFTRPSKANLGQFLTVGGTLAAGVSVSSRLRAGLAGRGTLSGPIPSTAPRIGAAGSGGPLVPAGSGVRAAQASLTAPSGGAAYASGAARLLDGGRAVVSAAVRAGGAIAKGAERALGLVLPIATLRAVAKGGTVTPGTGGGADPLAPVAALELPAGTAPGVGYNPGPGLIQVIRDPAATDAGGAAGSGRANAEGGGPLVLPAPAAMLAGGGLPRGLAGVAVLAALALAALWLYRKARA